MSDFTSESILNFIGGIDPSPFFVLSVIPYIVFLYFAQKSKKIPPISLWGFKLTLVFVFVTIVFAIFAKLLYGEDLTNVDPLHGGAEAFLALSDALIVVGFYGLLLEKR